MRASLVAAVDHRQRLWTAALEPVAVDAASGHAAGHHEVVHFVEHKTRVKPANVDLVVAVPCTLVVAAGKRIDADRALRRRRRLQVFVAVGEVSRSIDADEVELHRAKVSPVDADERLRGVVEENAEIREVHVVDVRVGVGVAAPFGYFPCAEENAVDAVRRHCAHRPLGDVKRRAPVGAVDLALGRPLHRHDARKPVVVAKDNRGVPLVRA